MADGIHEFTVLLQEQEKSPLEKLVCTSISNEWNDIQSELATAVFLKYRIKKKLTKQRMIWSATQPKTLLNLATPSLEIYLHQACNQILEVLLLKKTSLCCIFIFEIVIEN